MTNLPLTEPSEIRLEEPPGSLEALAAAGPDQPGQVARRYPACLTAWAALGEAAQREGHEVQAYACFRVGYHRGLDRLRRAGWRGRGTVPWSHEPNRGFLRSLHGLGVIAGQIGEQDEAERCLAFLRQLDPDVPDLTAG